MAATQMWLALQQDLQPYKTQLATMAETVVNEEVSNYPVFLAYPSDEQSIGLGLSLFAVPSKSGQDWALHLTTLEELVSRQIVQMEKVDDFRTLYKNNQPTLCFLIFLEGAATFGFLAAEQV